MWKWPVLKTFIFRSTFAIKKIILQDREGRNEDSPRFRGHTLSSPRLYMMSDFGYILPGVDGSADLYARIPDTTIPYFWRSKCVNDV